MAPTHRPNRTPQANNDNDNLTEWIDQQLAGELPNIVAQQVMNAIPDIVAQVIAALQHNPPVQPQPQQRKRESADGSRNDRKKGRFDSSGSSGSGYKGGYSGTMPLCYYVVFL